MRKHILTALTGITFFAGNAMASDAQPKAVASMATSKAAASISLRGWERSVTERASLSGEDQALAYRLQELPILAELIKPEKSSKSATEDLLFQTSDQYRPEIDEAVTTGNTTEITDPIAACIASTKLEYKVTNLGDLKQNPEAWEKLLEAVNYLMHLQSRKVKRKTSLSPSSVGEIMATMSGTTTTTDDVEERLRRLLGEETGK